MDGQPRNQCLHPQEEQQLRQFIQFLGPSPDIQLLLHTLRGFINDGDADENTRARRSRACGIVYLPNCLAIMTDRLGHALGKSKSWTNARLLRAGYRDCGNSLAVICALNTVLPECRSVSCAKKWTFRVLPPEASEPSWEPVDFLDDYDFDSDLDQ
jgi:hypothetical protein